MVIKICGITRLQDAQVAIEAGADALGFVFEPISPRYLPRQPDWQAWVGTLRGIRRVLVIADLSNLPAEWHLFDALQYTLPEGVAPDTFRQALPPLPLWLALRIKPSDTPESVLTVMHTFAHLAERFLLDAYHPDLPGGTGETHDWQRARAICAQSPRPVLLAGGLTPANVADAIRQVQPDGVDVSSGVEAMPGTKDAEKVRQFIHVVRAMH
ncbi:N-(5'-phosphoribosyl)anthranilate isomerase [bacterium HR15]|nr:N-(5'-phosphoribosyl)anthranilate isomerase [bacterium HR15]